MNMKTIQSKVFDEYAKNGYQQMWNRARELLRPEGLDGIVDLAELGLCITELCEAMEEVRNKKVDKNALMTECADAIIRILNFMSNKNCWADKCILAKHEKNLKREKLHGRGI